jgi:hypothetical protein
MKEIMIISDIYLKLGHILIGKKQVVQIKGENTKEVIAVEIAPISFIKAYSAKTP